MQTFKKGKAQVEDGKIVQTIPLEPSRIQREGFEEGYRACLDDLLKAANDVLSLAKDKWPNIFNEDESRRMLGYVKDVYAALETRHACLKKRKPISEDPPQLGES